MMLDILHRHVARDMDGFPRISNSDGDCGDGPASCDGCGTKIVDRFLMRVGSSSWHEQCVTCSACGVPLSKSCYYRHNGLYCKNDYDRLFGVKCGRCGEPLGARELVMRAGPSHVYHVGCFACVACMQPLQKGQQYVVKAGGGQLFCRTDFEKEIFLMQQTVGSPQPDDGLVLDENCRPRDGRRGPKRPRTILTSVQRRQFKASFEVSPKPCRKVREALAKDTGLSVRVVQVWFQNQRAKMKKIQRKSKQDDKNMNNNNANNTDKNETEHPTNTTSSVCSGDHYLSLSTLSMHDSSDSNYQNSQPLNPNIPYSPEGTYIGDHSVDSFCSSDVSLDGSITAADEIGSDTMSLDLSVAHGTGHHPNVQQQHHQHHHHHHHVGGAASAVSGQQINPIDKLYLMQNSYFNSNDH
ncbi:LIM homeobox transcription factor 1-beta-like isoform X1 [Sipha flava]|uniref:LIM homeobox transcription factor 1-beta-like isoform X1 n=2 Tax=Sipha flava TaxID=143950 RepID=A0A8B8GLN3_9HEMI|nr:LIM homeobox transcription factor 1-beta-like isoform X1 [Sipha flava]